ncbi:protein cholesin isoform X1 [Equus przewalskii]|uniref:Protein cholesin isoform X1 n=1 Tax=Equus przewalskii TaxID=9798 RepID=A0ABM4K5I0_EQUPR
MVWPCDPETFRWTYLGRWPGAADRKAVCVLCSQGPGLQRFPAESTRWPLHRTSLPESRQRLQLKIGPKPHPWHVGKRSQPVCQRQCPPASPRASASGPSGHLDPGAACCPQQQGGRQIAGVLDVEPGTTPHHPAGCAWNLTQVRQSQGAIAQREGPFVADLLHARGHPCLLTLALLTRTLPRRLGARQGAAACRALQETDPELSPEEKRVLERKLKKERKKEERKRLREAGTAAAQKPPARRSGAELALDYLCSWAQKHQDWRFQKTRQTWLLLHMYDSDKVPDKHFSTLLAYLEGLRGRARELTVQKAEALMQELDEAGAASPDPLLLEKTQRLRQVLQLLS